MINRAWFQILLIVTDLRLLHCVQVRYQHRVSWSVVNDIAIVCPVKYVLFVLSKLIPSNCYFSSVAQPSLGPVRLPATNLLFVRICPPAHLTVRSIERICLALPHRGSQSHLSGYRGSSGKYKKVLNGSLLYLMYMSNYLRRQIAMWHH